MLGRGKATKARGRPNLRDMRLNQLLCVFLGFGLSGCRGSLERGLDALEEGRLPAAAAELRPLEPEFRALDRRAQARYALYRGLVELGLGNATVADRWLSAAWRADATDPHVFDEREHGALIAAWRSTGRLPGEAGRKN
jgi:hypothetical protein